MDKNEMAGVAGLPESSLSNGCDNIKSDNSPAESAGNPQECRTSWVYFIGAGDVIKIGFSTRLTKRLRDLRYGTHEKLELLAKVKGGRDLERRYHTRFAKDRIKGEWFRATREILAEVRLLTDRPTRPTPKRPPLSEKAQWQIAGLRRLSAKYRDPIIHANIRILTEAIENREALTDESPDWLRWHIRTTMRLVTGNIERMAQAA